MLTSSPLFHSVLKSTTVKKVMKYKRVAAKLLILVIHKCVSVVILKLTV